MEITVTESKLDANAIMAGVEARVAGIMEHSRLTTIAAFIEERSDGWYEVVMEVDMATANKLFQEGRTPAEAFGEHVSAIMAKSDGGAGGNLTLGSLSAKYESNGKPGAIGHDNSGGWSYGAYQLASLKDSVAKFLNFLAAAEPGFAADLNAAGGDAAARAGQELFKTAWKKLASDHPERFLELQHGYIKASHYDKFVDKVKTQIVGLDIDARSLAVRNVAWSTAVQHGPANSVFKDALTGVQIADGRPGDEAIITAVYAERSNVDKRFPSVPELHDSLKERFAKEKGDALQMLA